MNHFEIIKENNNIHKMNEKLNNLKEIKYEEETVMYILVNNDLKMEKGKIAGQCCHSACRVTRLIESYNKNSEIYKNWIIVILQMKKEEMLQKLILMFLQMKN